MYGRFQVSFQSLLLTHAILRLYSDVMSMYMLLLWMLLCSMNFFLVLIWYWSMRTQENLHEELGLFRERDGDRREEVEDTDNHNRLPALWGTETECVDERLQPQFRYRRRFRRRDLPADSMVQHSQDNLESRLYRLPEELVLEVMLHLDWAGLFALRHSGRKFMRIFNSPQFRNWHALRVGGGRVDAGDGHCDPWMYQVLPFLPGVEPQRWTDVAAAHAEICCRDCSGWHRERARSNRYLHCLKCRCDHPITLFSAAALEAAERNGRKCAVCIAYEGHIRLCEHKTLDSTDVLDCLEDKNSLWGGLKRMLIPHTRYLYQVCRHPSHIPAHHAYTEGENTRPADENDNHHHGSVNSHDPNLLEAQLPLQAACASSDGNRPTATAAATAATTITKNSSCFPAAIIEDVVDKGDKFTVLRLTHTAHLDLSAHGTGAITADEFRQHMTRLRRSSGGARFMPLSEPAGQLEELRCVSPSQCSCLLYPRGGDEDNGFDGCCYGEAPLVPPPPWLQPRPCQRHTAYSVPYTRVNKNMERVQVRLLSCCLDDSHRRCLKIEYTRTICLEGFTSRPKGYWRPLLMNTGNRYARPTANPMMWQLVREAQLGRLPLGWYQALDPASYTPAFSWEDRRGDTSAYCRQPYCRYYMADRDEEQRRQGGPLLIKSYQPVNMRCRAGCRCMYTFDPATPEMRDRGEFVTIWRTEWMGRTE